MDREQFLLQTLGSKIKNKNIVNLAIKTDPVTAGIPIDKLDILINKMGIIIENSKQERGYTFDIYPVEDFIKEATEKLIEELKKY